MSTQVTTRSAASSGMMKEIVRALDPVALLLNLWRRRQLIRQLTWRDITGRYRSSLLGIAWSFLTPLVSLALYTFVFGVVFKARWPQARTDSLSEFGLMLFAGLTAFTVLSETMTRSTSIITSSPNYVKKVVFPLEVLPVSVVGSALFHAGISALILIIAHQILQGTFAWTAIFLPLVFAPLVCIALGMGWFLASVGVFFRDIGHTIGLITQVLLFTTPIFYPLEAIPENLRPLIQSNPLTAILDNTRRVTLQGQLPDWGSLGLSAAIGIVVLSLGHAWFIKTKRGFADVI